MTKKQNSRIGEDNNKRGQRMVVSVLEVRSDDGVWSKKTSHTGRHTNTENGKEHIDIQSKDDGDMG